MREALDNYFKKRTTITERQEEAENGFSPPVLVTCPIPAFKSAFSRKYKINGVHEKFFWQSGHSAIYFNDSVLIPELYKEMSFEYLKDFLLMIYISSGKESTQ